MSNIRIKPCGYCGTRFDNVFEATDHLLDVGDKPFDPLVILPSGYSLGVGSLLREIYKQRDNPDKIDDLVQSAYATLYMTNKDPALAAFFSIIEVLSERKDANAQRK